jgi:hypothetical protein
VQFANAVSTASSPRCIKAQVLTRHPQLAPPSLREGMPATARRCRSCHLSSARSSSRACWRHRGGSWCASRADCDHTGADRKPATWAWPAPAAVMPAHQRALASRPQPKRADAHDTRNGWRLARKIFWPGGGSYETEMFEGRTQSTPIGGCPSLAARRGQAGHYRGSSVEGRSRGIRARSPARPSRPPAWHLAATPLPLITHAGVETVTFHAIARSIVCTAVREPARVSEGGRRSDTNLRERTDPRG